METEGQSGHKREDMDMDVDMDMGVEVVEEKKDIGGDTSRCLSVNGISGNVGDNSSNVIGNVDNDEESDDGEEGNGTLTPSTTTSSLSKKSKKKKKKKKAGTTANTDSNAPTTTIPATTITTTTTTTTSITTPIDQADANVNTATSKSAAQMKKGRIKRLQEEKRKASLLSSTVMTPPVNGDFDGSKARAILEYVQAKEQEEVTRKLSHYIRHVSGASSAPTLSVPSSSSTTVVPSTGSSKTTVSASSETSSSFENTLCALLGSPSTSTSSPSTQMSTNATSTLATVSAAASSAAASSYRQSPIWSTNSTSLPSSSTSNSMLSIPSRRFITLDEVDPTTGMSTSSATIEFDPKAQGLMKHFKSYDEQNKKAKRDRLKQLRFDQMPKHEWDQPTLELLCLRIYIVDIQPSETSLDVTPEKLTIHFPAASRALIFELPSTVNPRGYEFKVGNDNILIMVKKQKSNKKWKSFGLVSWVEEHRLVEEDGSGIVWEVGKVLEQTGELERDKPKNTSATAVGSEGKKNGKKGGKSKSTNTKSMQTRKVVQQKEREATISDSESDSDSTVTEGNVSRAEFAYQPLPDTDNEQEGQEQEEDNESESTVEQAKIISHSTLEWEDMRSWGSDDAENIVVFGDENEKEKEEKKDTQRNDEVPLEKESTNGPKMWTYDEFKLAIGDSAILLDDMPTVSVEEPVMELNDEEVEENDDVSATSRDHSKISPSCSMATLSSVGSSGFLEFEDDAARRKRRMELGLSFGRFGDSRLETVVQSEEENGDDADVADMVYDASQVDDEVMMDGVRGTYAGIRRTSSLSFQASNGVVMVGSPHDAEYEDHLPPLRGHYLTLHEVGSSTTDRSSPEDSSTLLTPDTASPGTESPLPSFTPSFERESISDTATFISEEQVENVIYNPNRKQWPGLANMGNTCYMNTVLQCLASLPNQTVRYFLSGAFFEDVNTENVMGTGGELTKAFAEVLCKLYTLEDQTYIAPRDFKFYCQKHNELFNGFGQHDAQEFLVYLVDSIHEDCNRIKKKPYIEYPDYDESTPSHTIAKDFWSFHKQRNDSIVTDKLTGQIRSRIQCHNCQKTSVRFDECTSLSLEIPDTMVEMVTNFIEDATSIIQLQWSFPKETQLRDVFERVAAECGADVERLVAFYGPKGEVQCQLLDLEASLDECLIGVLRNSYFMELHPDRSLLFIQHEVPYSPNYSTDYLNSILPSLRVITIKHDEYERAAIYRYVYELFEDILFRDAAPKLGEEDLPFTFELMLLSPGGDEDDEEEEEEEEGEESDEGFESTQAEESQDTGDDISFVPGRHAMLKIVWKSQFDYQKNFNLKMDKTPSKIITDKEENSIELTDCIKRFVEEETMDDDSWYCSNCKGHQKISKKLDLWKLPEILIVHLKRFRHEMDYTVKLDTLVKFPVDELDLSEYVKDGGNAKYSLFAITNHYGDMNRGHYDAFCKRNGSWCRYDDETVSEVEVGDVMTEYAYVLFFEKVQESA